MTLSFRNRGNNQYLQDDGTTAGSFNSFRGRAGRHRRAPSVNWSYEVTLPNEGEWRLEATSVDTADQSDLRGETRDWTVSATARRRRS